MRLPPLALPPELVSLLCWELRAGLSLLQCGAVSVVVSDSLT